MTKEEHKEAHKKLHDDSFMKLCPLKFNQPQKPYDDYSPDGDHRIRYAEPNHECEHEKCAWWVKNTDYNPTEDGPDNVAGWCPVFWIGSGK